MPLQDYGRYMAGTAEMAAAPANALLGAYDNAQQNARRNALTDIEQQRTDIRWQQAQQDRASQLQGQQAEQQKAADIEQARAILAAGRSGNPAARAYAVKFVIGKAPPEVQASMAQADPEQLWSSIEPALAQAVGEKPESGGSGFGNVNPGDYTPESLAKFAQTRNYADLVRQYAPPAPPAVVVRDIAGVPSVVAPTRGGRASVTPLTNINTVAGNAGTVAGAEKGAQAAAEQRAGVAKRVTDATNSNEVLDLADSLVDASTGSLVGAAYDKVANVFGYAPKGDEAIAGLKVLQAKLMMSMPRMEGPQSDKDVQLYREAAGSLGDPTVPRNKKKVAIATIRRLNAQYAGKGGAPSGAPGMPPADRLKEGVVTHFANGQSWTLQNGQPVQVK